MPGQSLGSIIEQRWTVAYPPQRPATTTTFLGVSVDSVQAAGSAYTLAVEVATLTGCTAGTLTTSTGTTLGIVGRLELTLTGSDCHGTIRFLLTSGSNTARITARVAIMSSPTRDMVDLAVKFSWAVWAIVVSITRMIRNDAARMVTDFVIGGLLSLPLAPLIRGILAGATLALLILDGFAFALNPTKSIRGKP